MWRHLQCGCLWGEDNVDESAHHSKGRSMDGVSQVSSSICDRLRLASSKGQINQVEECLQAGATFDIDQDGRTALHYAALNGYTDVTKFLVEKGCDINIQDASGYTALHRAASQGHVEVITVLLENGCDVNTQDEHGNAALHEAAWNGFSKTLELLVKYDVNVVVTNKAGFTALHLAAQNGHNESSRVLLYAGCNNDHKNNYGDTALHTAARYGHAGVTRILISARAKLNEQNKNGDTALHIAAALKRRKIAKLLVDSGMDVHAKNKQNETAVDVSRRKDHQEIITIIQAFTRTPKNAGMKAVNFKEELDGPMVVPDRELPVDKPDGKADKGKKFFFFKKKKTKEKEKAQQYGGVTSQKTVPGPNVRVGNTPVQGFFSKYVPKQGVQYYRDLAGNVKQGPVGYSPTCNCMPTIHRLEKQVSDARDNVYGHIHSTNQAMQERIDQVDHRSSLRVHALEQYTRDRFTEEENMCRQRVNQRFQEHENHYAPQGEHMKIQIQEWLEQELEGYGHCLHHHHDDSALPNDNIFSDIHETANGRLFKSRSDETLSQSDNHSGKFRKREFYESRQAAMQQMKAWQVPSYSKDRNRIKVSEKQMQNTRNMQNQPPRSRSSQQVNVQVDPSRHYPMEPQIEVRTQNTYNSADHQFRNSVQQQQNNPYVKSVNDPTYMTMTGHQNQGAIPKHSTLPQSQSQQSFRQASGSRGPVTHSTPKVHESSPYETHSNMVRSQTDGVLSRNVQQNGAGRQQTTFQDREQDSHITPYQRGNAAVRSSRQLTFSEKEKDSGRERTPQTFSNPHNPRSSNNVSQVTPNVRNSTSSDKYISNLPKPTFTTFGYDDSNDGHAAPVNSPEQNIEAAKSYNDLLGSSTPRSNSSREDQPSKAPVSTYGSYNRQSSQGSYGFNPSTMDDSYMDMTRQSKRLHQRTRSSEGLLDNENEHVNSFNRSRSEERTLESPNISHMPGTPRSSSESRGGIYSVTNSPNSKSLPPQTVNSSPYTSYAKNSSHPQYSSTPYASQNSYNRPGAGPPTSPKPTSQLQTQRPAISPKPSPQVYNNPYTSVREIQRGSDVHYRGNANSVQLNGDLNSIQRTVQRNGDLNGVQRDLDNSVHINGNLNSVQQNGDHINSKENLYSSVRDVKMQKDRNHNFTAKADVHASTPNVYYSQSPVNGRSSVTNSNSNLLEPRSQTAYQTYLTGDQNFSRENSPNICNNSKEDNSSNPDSGYSSKIYGNGTRANSVTPVSCGSTPSSSFSTDRGISIPSNTNSPQSQYSNADYDALPKQQYHDEVQSHVQTWYQRKLQETTQKVYDNWKASPGKIGGANQNGGQRPPVAARNYGSDYMKIQYGSQGGVVRQGQGAQGHGQSQYGSYNGPVSYANSGQTNGQNMSTFVVHGSDV